MLTEREIREQALRWASKTEQLQRLVADALPTAHAKKMAAERALVLPRPKLDPAAYSPCLPSPAYQCAARREPEGRRMTYTLPANISEIRKQAWATRRARYGERGHSGSYSRFSASRRDAMLDLIIRLHAEDVLTEGQVAKATGLHRIEIRRLREQAEAAS